MNSLLDTNQDDLVQIDEDKDYLAELTGPGGKFDRSKYQSDEDMYKALAKGKYFGDATVEVQNRKMDELRDEYRRLRDESATSSSLKEVLDQIAELRKQSTLPPLTPQADLDKGTGFDPNQLDSLINNKIEEREARRIADQNFNKVKEKLVETFGANYSGKLQQQLKDQGLTAQDIDQLARRSPQAAIRLLGLDQQQQDNSFEAPTRGSVNKSFAPKSGEKRTWNWYQNLRAKDMNLYNSSKIQAQMYADAAELGQEFRDGDFYR